MKLKTVIADDEPLARERLRYLLSEDAEIEVVGECRNGREVIATLKSDPVDLLFLDIKMPSSDGFAVIEEIGLARMPLTVFVTAHNQYVVKAFEIHALAYLTKPVEIACLQSAGSHAKERIASKAALMTQDQLRSLLGSLEGGTAKRENYLKRLLILHGNKDTFVNVDEIEWVEAADYHCCLHVGAKSFMLRETIKQFASNLDPKTFVRVHRSIIVNVDQVREILRDGRGEAFRVMTNDCDSK